MPTTLTGTSSGGTADPVTLSAPASGDALASASMRTLLQKIIDTVQNVRAAVAAMATVKYDATYGTNWSGTGYRALRGAKTAAGTVQLEGQAVAAAGPGATIATLPAALRPSATRYAVYAYRTTCRAVKIDTDGTITDATLPTGSPPSAIATGDVLSFDGVSFNL